MVGNIDRQFNAHAIPGTRLVYIEKEKFRRLTRDYQSRVTQQHIEHMRRVPCFKGLTFRKLKSFVDLLKRVSLSAGQYLCKEGDKVQKLFIVTEGELVVTKVFEKVRPNYITLPERVFEDM